VSNEFYSNGKLLLSGEYLVMEGASALAVPVKQGQSLRIEKELKESILIWTGVISGKSWFTATYQIPSLEIIKTSNKKISDNLSRILVGASKINPAVFDGTRGYQIKTHLTFDINWGLGSSSSLISNIAYWFDINPYDLFWNIFEGSGYDIACARSYHPILYQLKDKNPYIKPIHLNSDIWKNVYFIYTGKKANTHQQIQNFKREGSYNVDDIDRITKLSKKMASAIDLVVLETMILEHEQFISRILNKKRIKDQYFSDYQGEMKSLGAWGGDFIMVTWRGKHESLKEYFREKGLEVIFRFEEMVL